MHTLTLRPATMLDAELLLSWRNDSETRAASHSSEPIAEVEHRAWLAKTLEDPARKLFVVEESNTAVGTMRADLSEGVWELSWSTAAEARGRGIARQMVAMLVSHLRAPVCAQIKASNTASARIAEHAGLALVRELDGILYFARDAVED